MQPTRPRPSRRRALAASIVTTTFLGLAVTAEAVPVDPRSRNVWLHGGSLSNWQVDNDIDYCVASGAFGFSDAEFVPPGESIKGDAIDGAMAFEVGSGDSEYQDTDGIVNKSGESVTGDPRTLARLRVSVTHTALSQKPVMRSLLKLVNNSSQARTRNVLYVNNSGGDTNEDVRVTGDGDDDVEPRDQWVVTSDHASAPTDPVKTWSLFGPGRVAEKVAAVVQEPDASDCLTVEFEIRVPARSTRYLLMFTRLSATNNAGFAAASDFDQEKAYLFKGLKPAVREKVLNWDVS